MPALLFKSLAALFWMVTYSSTEPPEPVSKVTAARTVSAPVFGPSKLAPAGSITTPLCEAPVTVTDLVNRTCSL